MRLIRHRIARRVRLAAFGTGFLAAALGASVMALLAGSSAAATAVAPTNVGEPTISGTPRVGEVLRTTRGTWNGTEPITYTYQWRRCEGAGKPDASDCARITNASNATYVVRQADVGFRIRSRVTATNADGSASAASNPTAVVSSARPANTERPTISGTAVVGNRLTADRGTWVGNQPMTYAFQWLRCNSSGDNCGEISGATDNQYVVVANDLGRTLRVRVTARNDAGSRSAISAQTTVVKQNAPPQPSGVIVLPTGERSIPVGSVPKSERLVISQVRFDPIVVTSRSVPITIRIRVTDTRGFVVRDALVFCRATPRVTTGNRLPTATDGWVTFRLQPLRTFPLKRGAQQFFVKAYRAGDPPLAGVAGYRLVQVIVRPV